MSTISLIEDLYLSTADEAHLNLRMAHQSLLHTAMQRSNRKESTD